MKNTGRAIDHFLISLPVFLVDWLFMNCPKSPSTLIVGLLIFGLQKCGS